MTRAPGRFWSNVKAVAYKETRILRHDRAFIGVIVAQPIMMLILQGAVLSNKPANVPWAVLDWSRSAVARRFVADVEATGYFLPPQSVASYDEGRRLLQQAEALAFVVIPETLARDVERGQPRVQLLLDGSDPLSAARVGGYIAQVGAALDLGTDTSQERRPEVPVRLAGPVDIRQRFWFNPTLADRRFFLSALAGMLLTNLCLSVMSLGLVGERESGTYEQMLALPTSSLEIVLGKVAPYVAVSYVLMFVSTAAAGVIFGVWPRGSWVTLSVATLPFVLASLAIGVFVSALARTSAQAVFIAVFFILPSFVLSGVIYPYQFMPRGVREIGGLFPLRWYQIALRRIIERGAGLVDVAGPMLALTLLFAVLLLAIRWRTKPRLG